MTIRTVAVGDSVTIGADQPLALIAGPCALESRELAMGVAEQVAGISRRIGMPCIFKSSFDKANRSSVKSYRGPGLEEGLEILREIGAAFQLPVLTDIHHPEQAAIVADAVDVLQIPAFLCRQTDLLLAAGQTGRVVNVKKGQFLSPWDTVNIVEKLRSTGNESILLTERGVSFGYQNLVVDMKSIPAMREQAPVVFDATHSVQQPGGLGNATGGQREYIPALAQAAVAAGADAVFLEVHPDPDNALSDGPNMLPLTELEELLVRLQRIAAATGRPQRS